MGCVCSTSRKSIIIAAIQPPDTTKLKSHESRINYFKYLSKTTLTKILDYLKYGDLLVAGKLNR